MNLLLKRLYDSGSATVGMLFFKSDKLRYVSTLEDTYNIDKIPGSTRIPAGQYEIKLRRQGKFFENYCKHENKKIAELTQKYGILHLQNVPNFEFVLIHTGNTNKDSSGCLLIGNNVDNFSIENGGLLTSSTAGYLYFIQHVFPMFDTNKIIQITILDTDRDIQEQFK
jgi:hypothetical protein